MEEKAEYVAGEAKNYGRHKALLASYGIGKHEFSFYEDEDSFHIYHTETKEFVDAILKTGDLWEHTKISEVVHTANDLTIAVEYFVYYDGMIAASFFDAGQAVIYRRSLADFALWAKRQRAIAVNQ